MKIELTIEELEEIVCCIVSCYNDYDEAMKYALDAVFEFLDVEDVQYDT